MQAARKDSDCVFPLDQSRFKK